MRLDLVINGSRAEARHTSECPEIGPICAQRAEPPQEHRTVLWLHDFRLIGEYGMTPNLALQFAGGFRLVDTRTDYHSLDGALLQLDYENIHHRNERLLSLTDGQLLIHGSTRMAGFNVGLRGGVNVPLGRTEPDPFVLGHQGLPHQHVQFGTGTVDPQAGLDISRRVGVVDISAFGFLHYPLLPNRHGYQAGARTLAGVMASHMREKSAFSYRVSAIVVNEAAERWQGHIPHEDGNQGRTDLYLSPGVTWNFATDWSASADLRVRAWGHVVGAQLNLPIVAQLSVGRLLHLESDEEAVHGPGEDDEDHVDVEDVVTNGEAKPLEPVAGKVTVFDFWAPWCEACKPLDRQLRETAKKFGIAVRRVNVVDFDSPIARQELPGVEVLPRIRVVGPDGAVLFEGSGPPEDLMAELRPHLPQQ